MVTVFNPLRWEGQLMVRCFLVIPQIFHLCFSSHRHRRLQYNPYTSPHILHRSFNEDLLNTQCSFGAWIWIYQPDPSTPIQSLSTHTHTRAKLYSSSIHTLIHIYSLFMHTYPIMPLKILHTLNTPYPQSICTSFPLRFPPIHTVCADPVSPPGHAKPLTPCSTSGEVDVIGRGDFGKPLHVCTFGYGHPVGELEFINNHVCVADVVAKTDVKTAKLSRRHFELVMGPVVDVLKRNAEQPVYTYYNKTLALVRSGSFDEKMGQPPHKTEGGEA